jgi:hypothetical protein
MEPDDEVQKTGDWDRLSPPTLTDISQIGHWWTGRIRLSAEIQEKLPAMMIKAEDKASTKGSNPA